MSTWNYDTPLEEELRQERDAVYEQNRRAQEQIRELRRRINAQRIYIAELEKQLEHCQPGLVREVREFLEGKEQA